MALGAARSSVLGLVFRRGIVTTAGGPRGGIAAAYAWRDDRNRWFNGVSPKDPATFIGIRWRWLPAAALAILHSGAAGDEDRPHRGRCGMSERNNGGANYFSETHIYAATRSAPRIG